jgi:hypothetical protein
VWAETNALQRIVSGVSAKIDTAKEYIKDGIKNLALRGQMIDTGVRRVLKDAGLYTPDATLAKQAGQLTGKSNKGPDLIRESSELHWDMTTTKSFAEHWRKYGSIDDLLLLETSPRVQGLGVGLNASSSFSDWLGGKDAAGGFVIYPSKTNANMMRQVYSK